MFKFIERLLFGTNEPIVLPKTFSNGYNEVIKISDDIEKIREMYNSIHPFNREREYERGIMQASEELFSKLIYTKNFTSVSRYEAKLLVYQAQDEDIVKYRVNKDSFDIDDNNVEWEYSYRRRRLAETLDEVVDLLSNPNNIDLFNEIYKKLKVVKLIKYGK